MFLPELPEQGQWLSELCAGEVMGGDGVEARLPLV